MRFRLGRQPARPLRYALIGLALLVQGLLPIGWMPAFAADGMRLVPCSSYWPEEFASTAQPEVSDAHSANSDDPHEGHRAAPSHHGSDEEGEQKAASSTCAFAGSSGVAPPLFAPTVQAIFLARQIEPVLDRPAAIGRGLAAPPPPATGPPLTT